MIKYRMVRVREYVAVGREVINAPKHVPEIVMERDNREAEAFMIK